MLEAHISQALKMTQPGRTADEQPGKKFSNSAQVNNYFFDEKPAVPDCDKDETL
jgi:hypothetical protein